MEDDSLIPEGWREYTFNNVTPAKRYLNSGHHIWITERADSTWGVNNRDTDSTFTTREEAFTYAKVLILKEKML